MIIVKVDKRRIGKIVLIYPIKEQNNYYVVFKKVYKNVLNKDNFVIVIINKTNIEV